MILVDTGPLVALFDPKDQQHGRCVRMLRGVREPIRTTVPVLTDASLVAAAEALLTLKKSRVGLERRLPNRFLKNVVSSC